MNQNEIRIKQLLRKPQWAPEDAHWWAAYTEQGNDAELRAVAQELFEADVHQLRTTLDQKLSEQMLQNIHQRIRKPKIIRWLPYAAAILVVLSVGIVYFATRSTQNTDTNLVYYTEDIAPGGNRATLTLANGQTVQLRTEQQQLIVDQEITYGNGDPVLQGAPPIGSDAKTTALNTLTTPKGGQYQITLPDGTQVWLNAASVLRYPRRFDNQERVVELEGEAYFDVAHVAGATSQKSGSIPFVVKTKMQTIQVLGTEFNITAYTDEPDTKTTLVEGRVQIHVPAVPNITLAPGEQAIVKNGTLSKQKVDVRNFIGWKNGVMILDKSNLHAVVRQIERWYNVEFDWGQLPHDTQLNGVLHRDAPLSGILEVLALNTGKSFEIKERRVIVR